METMERDPQYIAETVRFLRKMFALTQENLADAANLTTRTIEKVESGRHHPSEQTLRCIARALSMETSVFDKPTPTQEQRQRVEFERAIRKTVVVPTSPIKGAQDFLSRFGQPHAFRFDMSAVSGDEAMETAAGMFDYLEDMMLAWSDVRQSDRLACAREFAAMCADIEGLGFLCHLGRHGQQLRERGKPTLAFDVALVVALPKDQADGERYTLVQLEGAWETLEKDRVEMPTEWRARQSPSNGSAGADDGGLNAD